jgi:pyridoxamine 5'-phosphate oxidase
MKSPAKTTGQYTLGALNEADLDPDPIQQFGQWFEAAVRAEVLEPSAMTLATATADGMPSARIVLLKEFDARGFAFYTNYESQKGRELDENPRAALVCFWPVLERQVRLTGSVTKVTREESEAYFHNRPVPSQIGVWASRQSAVLSGRKELEDRFQKFALEFGTKSVPLPDYWGGYRVYPNVIEFWQGRPSRLHDRFRYTRVSESTWRIERLSP